MFNFLFSFSDRREKKRFVLNRVGADLQMFKSGSNNRGVAEVKDIMATEKRSQVARLVLWTFIHTFSGYLLNFRKRFSSGNVCWHRPGSHWMWQGFCWNFMLYMKLVAGELACDNSHFSLLLATGNVLWEGTSATQWQKFHTYVRHKSMFTH